MPTGHADGVVPLDSTHSDSARRARAKKLRTLAWVALPVMALVYYALLVSPLPPLARLVALELVYCAPIVLTIVWSWRARALSEGAERVFWTCMAGANFVLLDCELLLLWWVAVVDPAGPPRVSWPFHIMHGLAAVFFLVGLASLSRLSQATGATRVRWLLDLAALELVAAMLLLEFYVRPIMGPAGASVAEIFLGVCYPLFGLTMVVGTLAFLVGFKVERWRPWDKLFTVSLVIYAVAISLWPIWFTTAVDGSRNYERGVLDLVQFSGHWLLMAAAIYRLTEVTEWKLRPLPPMYASRKRWASAVVPAILLLAVPAMALLAETSRNDGEWYPVFLVAFTVLTALALARSAVIALENGALFHRSISDPLTGLYNHRFFHDRLADEVERARRYHDEVSVIVVDVDDFTEFNARHGHAEGERLLRQVASLVRSRCGVPCVPARLGADDFAVIAPETGRMDATVLARSVIDFIAIGAGGEPGSVTASAGVATFPQDGSNAEELMRAVMGALYQAKLSGAEHLVAYEDERVIDLSPAEHVERLEYQNRLSSVRALAAAVDARDAATHDHARNVAYLASQVCDVMGMGEAAAERTRTAALLHDVGKIGTPDGLLVKPQRLTEREWDAVRDHAALGQRILADAGLTDLLPIVRSHHEWWDGTGYPDALAGDEIPLEARVLAVCDAYDAMISDRPYRAAYSRRQARAEIAKRAGTQFDPEVVSALEAVLESGPTVPVEAPLLPGSAG